jgi:predicted nuclease of restriction endonuclease-like RecB superfamily
MEVEVRGERPARYRQLLRQLKFHRLMYVARGTMSSGYTFHIDGPLSLFSATNKYGLQMALFLPALLPCENFRLTAELRWGPKRDPRSFQLESRDGLVSHLADTGQYVPAEISAFLERFRQLTAAWRIDEATDNLEHGSEGVWVPDYRCVHEPTGTEVFLEILGFWNKSTLERLLRLLPSHGPERYILAVSDRMKVDDGELKELAGPVMRFKEIPSAPELLKRLEGLLPRSGTLRLLD